MKAQKSILVLVAALLFTTTVMAGAFDKAAEKTVVKETIEKYVHGINKRNANEIKDVLYENSNFIKLNVIVNKVTESTTDDFLKALKSGRLGFWKEVEVSAIEVTEQMAHATLNIGTAKLKQLEYISLFKVEGEWKIVSVLSTLEKK